MDIKNDNTIISAAFTFDAEVVAQKLGVDCDTGLNRQQVMAYQQRYGANRLPEMPPRKAWRVFISQFKSVLIMVLIGAAVLAALTANLKDAIIILTVVVINAFVGFYQEYRAEQSLTALKKMLPIKANVRREDEKQEIDAAELVPGDIVLLEAGDQVPADGRLFVAAGLELDESSLTGESLPVEKLSDAIETPDVTLADRNNMVYMNTMVTRGRAEVIVTATGVDTEMGQLSQQLAVTEDVATPLQIQIDRLGKRLGVIAMLLVGLLSFLALLRGVDPAHIVLEAIALAVAAMPEGLPVVVTVTLALGMRKMARQRAMVKRLASVETLGCTTVICADKTGTLTLNQMTVRAFYYSGERYQVSGTGYRSAGQITASTKGKSTADLTPVLIPVVACNDSRIDEGNVIGDPMEAALVVLGNKGGINQDQLDDSMPRLAEIPFDSEHKYMATFHQQDEEIHIYIKGAPDVLLKRCSHWLMDDSLQPLTDDERQRINDNYASLAKEGLRGLMVATKIIAAKDFDADADLMLWIRELTFIALVGLMDPPRPEAKQAIEECHQAGIAVKMITGDHESTASAVARELGLEGETLNGKELDRLSLKQLAERIERIAVFARVNPAHKVKIVQALQSLGHVVAMTGDGVNDAPALKRSDIGVAMGEDGTDVAKEAATMILTDDNFATIVAAVRQGRALYDNILKFIRFQLSTTIGAILTVFFAPFAGLPEPFTPIQILWVAIIMDGPPAISLALDAARPDVMQEVPRSRSESVLPISRLGKILVYGITMMVGTLLVLYYGMHTGSEQRALTLAFTTFVLFQFFNVFNARAEYGTAFNRSFFKNPMLWISISTVVVLQVIAVQWPAANIVFNTGSLSLQDWCIAVGVAFSILALEESRKLIVMAVSKFQHAETT
ncbi:calcium-translocating P-type ATPase, PMCA-type [Kaarinaea lacus]